MIGFDIGGTKCAVCVGEEKDGKLQILDKRSIPTDHNVSPYEMINRMCTLAEEMTKQAKKVQKEMTKAQSDKKPKKVDSLAKVKTQKAKKKVDTNKDNLIQALAEFGESCELIFNPQMIKNGQLSFKDAEGNYYSLKLTKHKTMPDGYKE